MNGYILHFCVSDGRLGCLSRSVIFSLYIHEHNIVLHRLPKFRISFTQLLIDIKKNFEDIRPNAPTFHFRYKQ